MVTLSDASVADIHAAGIRGYYWFSPRGFANEGSRYLLIDGDDEYKRRHAYEQGDANAVLTMFEYEAGVNATKQSETRSAILGLIGDIWMLDSENPNEVAAVKRLQNIVMKRTGQKTITLPKRYNPFEEREKE